MSEQVNPEMFYPNKPLGPTNKVLCIYHATCHDGLASAYVVGKYFGMDQVEFKPMQYREPIPDLTDRTVYIVDFSFPPEELLPAVEKAGTVTMIDHHKTAHETWEKVKELPVNLKYIYDIDHSGCVLTWHHFFRGGRNSVPDILTLIEDRDLWKWLHKGSKPLNAAMEKRRMKFGTVVDFSQYVDHGPALKQLIEEGEPIIKEQDREIGHVVACSRIVHFDGMEIPCSTTARFIGEVGHELCWDFPFSLTYFDDVSKGLRIYSLRSRHEGGADVGAIAKRWGGGGHEHAAGFTRPLLAPFVFTFLPEEDHHHG